MRIVLAITLAIGWPAGASACMCLIPPPKYFLHTVSNGDALPYVYIPANAKGILFFRDSKQNMHYIDERTNTVSQIPPALLAAHFSIVEQDTGRAVPSVVTRLNVDRQMEQDREVRFFLGSAQARSC